MALRRGVDARHLRVESFARSGDDVFDRIRDGDLIEVPTGFEGPARDAAVAGQKRADREGVSAISGIRLLLT